jgi:hypothetical protein
MIDVSKYQNGGPGKFEGEPPQTGYYWEQMLNGDGETIYAYGGDDDQTEADFADTDEACADLFQVDAEESEAFGLPIGSWQMLWSDSLGFAYSQNFPTREAAEDEFNSWYGA